MNKKIGNNNYLKEMNKSIILDLIRTTNGVSRKALADMTGLSATASGTIVKSLIKEGFIFENGEGESSGGRKPVKLELKPNSYFAFGFDIDVHYIYTVVMDITGKVVYSYKKDNSSAPSASQAVDSIILEYNTALSKLKISQDKILGIGVSIPGLVDLKSRDVILAPNIGWSNVSILELLQHALGTPIFIENESMCSAFCENWIGLCQDIDDFICINIESGIGAGLFLKGEIYRGFSGSAGEVGHIPVDEDGPSCMCGNVGCLETIASINGMVSRSFEANFVNTELAFRLLLNKAGQGDVSSIKIFHDAAYSLGKAIAYLINILNMKKIILGKRFPEYSELVIDIIRKTAAKYALKHPSRHVEIVASNFGEESSALGAAIIPIRKLFGK